MKKKCIMNKEEEKERKGDEIKFGMTSIPLQRALLGITL